jgi:predicted polyphosphate/ATP-dependent NAD kinase
MKLGLVINPTAGGGLTRDKIDLINSVVRKLNPDLILTSTKAVNVGVQGFKIKEVPVRVKRDRTDTTELVRKLDGNADLILIFGGDGTMSDAASVRPETPLLCIGTGTTNVSPVLCKPDFKPNQLKKVKVRGLELRTEDDRRIAFNDVVVGSTILATVDGKRVQVDARSFMRGKKTVALPRKFKARIEVGGRVIEGTFGNVFISLLDDRFLGRGITGGVSLSTFLGFKGVIACVSEGVIVSTYTKDEVRRIEPIITSTMSFDDEVVVICSDEVISCDGNPVTTGYAEVQVVEDAVTVMKEIE